MKKRLARPTVAEIHQEIARRRSIQAVCHLLLRTLCSLAVVAAITVLLFTLWTPMFRITGSSMYPTLRENERVVAVKTDHIEPGDVIAFFHNNQVLIKRVIATGGQSVDIREDGTVLVDGSVLEESYVKEPHKGACSISLPCRIQEGTFFVMGDNRPFSVDSRSASIGTISSSQIAGRVLFKLWPLSAIGKVK